MSDASAAALRRRFLAPLAFELDEFQRKALDQLDEGANVLVSAPTGAGKTLVAGYAIAKALEAGTKAFYTTPLKALSNQKFTELMVEHGSLNVGLLTGDSAIRATAPIVVMTTEVLRNMLLTNSPLLEGLGCVVLDEVHFIQDPYRGGVWEEVLIMTPPEIQFCCLSATVANASVLGDWIESVRGPTSVIVERTRPIILRNHVALTKRGGHGPQLIDLLDGEEIIPQSQCHMSGESSTAATANGTIKSYKWTVLSQPAGAVGYGFFPNDHASKVTFGVPTNKADGTSPVQINVAGKYDFKLTVTDDKGNVSCSPAYAEVTVVPDQAIHVQLTWDTPNDTDKNDTGMDAGSDLDMHVVHPNAYLSQLCVDPPKMCGNKACACLPDLDQDGAADPWFNTPFDCYWNNPVPKWGSLNLNDDDGTLDLDDTDGWGPENFSIKSPENSTKYGVGVHYWDDHGFGDSTATAIIYVLGVAKGTFVQKMTQCDMWWVTQIDWPSGDFVDFPGAKFVAPSVGKITPKYWAGFSGGLGAPCFKGMK